MRKRLLVCGVLMAFNCNAQDYAYIVNAMTNEIVVDTINSNGDLVYSGKKYSTPNDPEDWSIYNGNKNFYTLSWGENKISEFQLSANGVLTPLQPRDISTGVQPWLLALTPDGTCGYTGNYGDGSISAFKIQPDGRIISVGTINTTLGRLAGTRVDTASNLLFVVSNSNNKVFSYTIDRSSCKISQTAFIYETSNQPARMRIIKLKNNKQYLYIINSGTNLINEYEVNNNGSLRSLGSIASGGVDPMNIFIPDGVNGYVPNRGSGTISWFKVSDDGALNFIKTYSTNGSGSRSLTFDKNAVNMYVANQYSNDLSRFKINLDGSLTFVTKYNSGGVQPFGMSIVTNQ